MFASVLRQTLARSLLLHFENNKYRLLSAPITSRNYKVAVFGAGGGIGQPLALLLKLNPLVTQLALYDIVNTLGVAADLSHIDTASYVYGATKQEMAKVFKCSNIVVSVAGMPRKPGMSREDLFKVNAGIIKEMAAVFAETCPKAMLCIVTNPVNSTVPIAAEVLKEHGVYDPNRLFGVTTLDLVRTRTFIGNILDIDPKKVKVPIVGGHSNTTIIPVISHSKPEFKGDRKTIEKLTKRIQDAGNEILEAKEGKGSATLSMAHAAAIFTDALLRGLNGQKNVVECSYVESCVTEAKFFATPLVLGKEGIKENLGLPDLDEYECGLLEKALPDLKKHIETGIKFAKSSGQECATPKEK